MALSGRLDPAVAAVRLAVRLGLADVEPGRRVVVACSGGADSMALAAATAFEGARAGWLTLAVVVDHGWHRDSADVAATVALRLKSLEPFAELHQVDVERVDVGTAGGPEGAARKARYQALGAHAARLDALVLLGHTRDDQAECVLLGLARGSGPRSLAGMRAVAGPYRRPLLTISRAQTTQASRALGVPVWQDPANADVRFARTRVRRTVLPLLETELGPGVAEALARTADQLAADVDALDALAAEVYTGVRAPGEEEHLDVSRLVDAPAAIRRRVLRLAALAAGCPAGELGAVHVHALDALVTHWHGQRGVDLPGSLTAGRRGRLLWFTPLGARRG